MTNIKFYKNNNIMKKFLDEDNIRQVPKENYLYRCSPLISLDFIIRKGFMCYPQIFLEKCEYKLIEDFITDDFDSISESDSESDDESDNE